MSCQLHSLSKGSCMHASSGNSGVMVHQAARCLTISNLPTDVLSCIVNQLQQDDWQHAQLLDGIAALRSVCRSLRAAVDLTVTHAAFHDNAGDPELRTIFRRCTGVTALSRKQHSMT
jgi:F-box domain